MRILIDGWPVGTLQYVVNFMVRLVRTVSSRIAATRTGIAALLFIAFGLAIPAPPVSAHSLVERSEPPANRLLLRPPSEIVLVFSEPVDPRRTEIRVLDQEGRRIDRGDFRFSADRRQARLPVTLPGPGIYTVTWTTLSTIDLHTYEGFFTFTLGPLRPGSFSLQAGRSGEPSPVEIGLRWLIFLGAAVLTGGLVVHTLLLPAAMAGWPPNNTWQEVVERRWRLIGTFGAALVLAGTLGDLTGQAARVAAAAGEPLAATVSSLATSDATRVPLALKIGATVGLLFLLHRRSPNVSLPQPVGLIASSSVISSGITVRFILAGFLLLGVSLTSHAAASGILVLLAVDWLHLLSAAVWAGGLIYLAVIVVPTVAGLDEPGRARLLGPLIGRFSNVALASVAVLIITGVYAAVVNIPAMQAITATAYGRTLSIKVSLLIPLLAVAAVNLLVMRPRLVDAARKVLTDASGRALRSRFFRLVRSESVLVSLVLAAASTLAILPTARQVWALNQGRDFALVRRTGDVEGILRIKPYQVGENRFELRLRNLRSELTIPDARVRFTFLPLATNLGTTVAEATPQGNGRYEFQGTFIGARGPWLITVTVRRRGLEDAKLLYPAEPDWNRGTPITPASDPQAVELLRRADQAMNRLRSLRQRQEITDGAGNDVVTFFELAAPNAMRYRVIGGGEVIYVGDQVYTKHQGNSWRRESNPFPFKVPNFTFASNSSSVIFGPREVIDGRQAHVVTFILNLAGSKARYAVWIDEKHTRIVREWMVARSHYMIIRNYDFNAPLKIQDPPPE